MDEIDFAQQRVLEDTQRAIAAARKPIPPGEPGECDLCGEWCGRLIGGNCARCRDKHKLP